jgi:diaminopimelate decarboxylase
MELINIDNLSILEQFGAKTPSCSRMYTYQLRNGRWKHEYISVGHIDSKFGISLPTAPHLVRIVENTKMNIVGIHMHTGSDS